MKLKKSNIRLAVPYPDEHIYSVLLRTFYRNGQTSSESFKKRHFNHHSQAFFGFNMLSAFEDPKEAFELTEFPFYLSVLNEKNKKIIKDRILEGQSIRRIFPVGFLHYKDKGFAYCSECLKEDREKGIFPYYRTYHQIHGVESCPIHKVKLKYLKKNTKFVPLTSEFSIESQPASSIEIKLAENLIKIKDLERQKLVYAIRKEIIKRDFNTISGGIDSSKLLNYLSEIYDLDYLESLGIKLKHSYPYWIDHILNNTKVVTLLPYLLLITAFDIDLEALKELDLSRKNVVYLNKKTKEPFFLDYLIIDYRKMTQKYKTRDELQKHLFGVFDNLLRFDKEWLDKHFPI